jgi:hypothetical protein
MPDIGVLSTGETSNQETLTFNSMKNAINTFGPLYTALEEHKYWHEDLHEDGFRTDP